MFRAALARLVAGCVAVASPFAVTLAGDARLPTHGAPGDHAVQARERVVYVSAVDANQRPVPGLTPDAFVIREDGVRREVLRVTPATSPMPVAIIVDNSQAAEPAIADLRRALAGFVRAIDGLGPVALVTVADRPTIVADYTPTAKTVLDAVDRLFHAPNSGATLLDAMRDIANGLTRREADRAAMVVVTTENTEFSHARYQDVLDSIRKAGVTTHVVVLTNPNVSMASEEARSRATVLDRGPRESGGLRMDLLTSMAFEPRLADLAAVLRAQYRIVYARPDALIPPERVTVTAAQAGIAMHGAPARGQGAK